MDLGIIRGTSVLPVSHNSYLSSYLGIHCSPVQASDFTCRAFSSIGPKRDSSMFFLSIDSWTHKICWQEMDLWCIISKYMDVLKGEGSLLLSTQPNIQSCYLTVTSHKHTHAIQFTLTVGKGIFKRYHSYGYVWFLHTKPSPLYGLHTPGFSTQMHTIHSPSLVSVDLMWCHIVDDVGLTTTATTVPLSSLWRKVCWKEGNPLLQIQRCTPVPALWRTNHWRVDLGIIRGTSVLPVSLSPINHITPRNLTRGWMMKSFWNIQRRDYS